MAQLQKLLRLIPPHMDKNWSIQGIHFSEEEIQDVKMCFVKIPDASPYLQGNSNGWFMVEFWTRDMVAIHQACQVIADCLGMTYSKVENSSNAFTREELGID